MFVDVVGNVRRSRHQILLGLLLAVLQEFRPRRILMGLVIRHLHLHVYRKEGVIKVYPITLVLFEIDCLGGRGPAHGLLIGVKPLEIEVNVLGGCVKLFWLLLWLISIVVVLELVLQRRWSDLFQHPALGVQLWLHIVEERQVEVVWLFGWRQHSLLGLELGLWLHLLMHLAACLGHGILLQGRTEYFACPPEKILQTLYSDDVRVDELYVVVQLCPSSCRRLGSHTAAEGAQQKLQLDQD